MATGDQVTRPGIVIPISKARFAHYPVISGNCLTCNTDGDSLGAVTISWATKWSVFYKAKINNATGGSGRLISANNGNEILLTLTGVKVQQGGSSITLGEAVTEYDVWHDYAIVYDGTFVRAYKDGVVVSCGAFAVNPFTTSDDYYIFNRPDGLRVTKGIFAYFQWYNRAFEPEEVFAHYHSEADNKVGCVVSYRLQEGTGTTATDTSGNGRDATIAGCAWSTFSFEDVQNNISTYDGATNISSVRTVVTRPATAPTPVLDTTVTGSGNGSTNIDLEAITTSEANEALICVMHTTADVQDTVTITGGGLTWTQLANSPVAMSTGITLVYYALATEKLTATTFNILFGGDEQTSAVLSAYKGINPTDFIGTIGTTTTEYSTNCNITASTVGTNSLVIGCWGQTTNDTFTTDGDETINSQVGSAGGFSRAMQAKRIDITPNPDTSVTMNAGVAGNRVWSGFYIELLARVIT